MVVFPMLLLMEPSKAFGFETAQFMSEGIMYGCFEGLKTWRDEKFRFA